MKYTITPINNPMSNRAKFLVARKPSRNRIANIPIITMDRKFLKSVLK